MGKTYFLPPDFWSYPAAQGDRPGAIRLGQLISDINDPGHTIATLPPLAMDPYDMQPDALSVGGLGHSDDRASTFMAELLVKAVSLVGIKLKASVESSEKLLSEMDSIEAEVVEPRDAYVKASMEQAEVQAWLKRTWPRKRVFIVSGILIARPAGETSKISLSSSREVGGAGTAKADTPAPQAPVQGGAEGSASRKHDFSLSFVPKTPFIYAFRLRECFLKKGYTDSVPYTKGAKMHADGTGGSGDPEEQRNAAEDSVFTCSGASKKDVKLVALGEAGEGLEQWETTDGAGDMVSLVF